MKLKLSRTSRRRFLLGLMLGTPTALAAHVRLFEPTWLKIRRLRLTHSIPQHRFIHFTDLHHKGDRHYALTVVKEINSLSPDFVCFTGDLLEDAKFLPETLEILAGIRSPLYGVPGNHDYWSKISFDPIVTAFEKTGGGWLLDEHRLLAGGKINLIGLSCKRMQEESLSLQTGAKNILLMHYPAWAKQLGTAKLDLILAGHSHGGQVRLPFYGPISIPFGVDEYDLGLFQTPAGPLYVNSGIGWFFAPVRFNCRPEITVFEM